MASLGDFLAKSINALNDVLKSSGGRRSNNFTYKVTPKQAIEELAGRGGRGGRGGRNFNLPRQFRWRAEALNAIKIRIRERIFEMGLNSDDISMAEAVNKTDRRLIDGYRPEANTTFRYRYKTGTLANSLQVQSIGRAGNLTISFSRERAIIARLTNQYGEFLPPSPSDLSYIYWIYLRESGAIPANTPPPRMPARVEPGIGGARRGARAIARNRNR